jgi:hypothetical protein
MDECVDPIMATEPDLQEVYIRLCGWSTLKWADVIYWYSPHINRTVCTIAEAYELQMQFGKL